MITLTASALYDRYLLALIPAVAGLLARAGSRADVLAVRSRVVPIAFLLPYALEARRTWMEPPRLGRSALGSGRRRRRAGIKARNIDAGFEWYSYHQHRAVRLEAPPTELFGLGSLAGNALCDGDRRTDFDADPC
jgi:hypothetical protein